MISQSWAVKISLYFIHRLYSDYLYFASSNKSADDFHEKVTEALQLFENCMLDYSLRACVYNNTLNNAMPVRILEAPHPQHRRLGAYYAGGMVDGMGAQRHREVFECADASPRASEWWLMHRQIHGRKNCKRDGPYERAPGVLLS